MGLDMYFNKHTYIGNKWKEKDKIIKLGVTGIDDKRVSYIVEEIGYLRKANAIHTWIIENCADGKDDCKDVYLSSKKVEELLKIVDIVLTSSVLVDGKVTNGYEFRDGKEIPILEDGKIVENSSIAVKLLPTQTGFFFGSTEYDENYIRDLEETKRILKEILKDDEADYYYVASW